MSKTVTEENALTRFLVPAFLIFVCPPFAMLMWHVNVNLDGSFAKLYDELLANGLFNELVNVWWAHFFGSATAWKVIGVLRRFSYC